jgi:regulator of protease activity HflC (stomatin/prohibitin superfamily)
MKIIKKLFGLDKLEASIAQAEQDLQEANIRLAAAEAASKTAEQAEETAKLTPKERATRRKEAWVGVINTHVNKDNIRNGFFELDWNEQFVLQLKQEGYGEDGDKDEEIVDRWFRELCANVVVDGDFGGPVNTGVIDIQTVKKTNQ